MTNSPTITIRIPPEIRAALEAAASEVGETIGPFLLRAACNQIGRQDLVEKIRPPNRPKKKS